MSYSSENCGAGVWRDIHGRPWLRQAPPKISRLSTKGKQAKPYPLTWDEQTRLLKALPSHLADAVLFAVNTGCRELEVCQLRWQWEVPVKELGISVFVLPETFTKTQTERVIAINSVARKVVEAQRGKHPEFVFNYNGKPRKRLHSNGWRRAWKEAGLPVDAGVLKGVHNLRHTFGRRLRAEGVPLETRKSLMGHANGDITTHYSAAELGELIDAAERIVDRGIAQTPTLSIVHQSSRRPNVAREKTEKSACSQSVAKTKKG